MSGNPQDRKGAEPMAGAGLLRPGRGDDDVGLSGAPPIPA